MSNIIEKMGIKPIERGKNIPDENSVSVNIDDLNELEQQNNELLEKLIEIHDAQFNKIKSLSEVDSSIRFSRKLIEKIAGISWKEIKELL